MSHFCSSVVKYDCIKHTDSRNIAFCRRKTPQGGTGGGAVSKSHHSSRMNSGGNMNATGNRGGWSNRGGSKNQLGPDKQHRQNGMLTSGKKGDQNKMPLSKSVQWLCISCCVKSRTVVKLCIYVCLTYLHILLLL